MKTAESSKLLSAMDRMGVSEDSELLGKNLMLVGAALSFAGIYD